MRKDSKKYGFYFNDRPRKIMKNMAKRRRVPLSYLINTMLEEIIDEKIELGFIADDSED